LSILVSCFDKHIVVRAPFTFKDRCKSIAGARWDASIRAWTYPRTAFSAIAIKQEFPHSSIDEETKQLIASYAHVLEAEKCKSADDLEPIPLTNLSPWKHQLRAYHFAKSLSAVMLGLDMGTGKSKVAIDLIVNRNLRVVLIVCPKSVVSVWPLQFSTHSPITFTVCALSEGRIEERREQAKQAIALAAARKSPIAIVMNYDAAWTPHMRDWVLGQPWDAVVLDESHRIKQPGGKTSLFFSRLGDVAPLRICLTGTPMPHSPLDIYGQYRFLDKGIFGTSFSLFRSRYARTMPVGGAASPYAQKIIGFQNLDELHRKMYQICFRVKASDVQDLPPVIDTVRHVTIGSNARRIYNNLKKEFVSDLGRKMITASNALTRLLRLQQVAAGYAREDDDVVTGRAGELVEVDRGKHEALMETLESLADDEPVVVFCRFIADLDTVHSVAKQIGRRSLELSGRRNELAGWQGEEAPILAVQIKAGSVGIDLTRSRYAIYFTLGFSLGDYLQSRKRLDRPGQTRTVTNIHLIATDTVDQQIYDALEKRQDVVEQILEHGLV
jgi:SNF2 family DNA or RNA helicase